MTASSLSIFKSVLPLALHGSWNLTYSLSRDWRERNSIPEELRFSIIFCFIDISLSILNLSAFFCNNSRTAFGFSLMILSILSYASSWMALLSYLEIVASPQPSNLAKSTWDKSYIFRIATIWSEVSNPLIFLYALRACKRLIFSILPVVNSFSSSSLSGQK